MMRTTWSAPLTPRAQSLIAIALRRNGQRATLPQLCRRRSSATTAEIRRRVSLLGMSR